MRIPIASWTMLDWQGPATNVRFRVTADDTFLARDDDGTHVQVEAFPKVFREVSCTVDTVTIDGLLVKRITIPAMWLYSTNDAIVNRSARYSAAFVTASGQEIMRPEFLQSFQLIKELRDVFNPVPMAEIIRANSPSVPTPMDFDTFSKAQILELIGDGPTQIGTGNVTNRIAVWQSPTTIGGFSTFSDTVFEAQDGDPVLKLTRFEGDENIFTIQHNTAVGNTKVLGFGAALSLHLVDAGTQWHLMYANDASNFVWVNNHFDGGQIEFRAYTDADVLEGRIFFDEQGGVGVARDTINTTRGWLFRDVDGFHLGTSASGIDTANRQITFLPTNIGIGINKPTGITSQLHVESGSTTRPAMTLKNAAGGSGSLDIALFLSENGGFRFGFTNDGLLKIGQLGAVRGRIEFRSPSNTNLTTIEPADAPSATTTYRLPATPPSAGQLLRTVTIAAGLATLEWVNPTAGGDVSSDIGVAVDNTLTRFQGTSGKQITDSAIIVADTTGSFTVPNGWAVSNAAGVNLLLSNPLFSVSTPPTAVTGFSSIQLISGAQAQSSGIPLVVGLAQTFNQSGTAGSDSISIVRIETALGSGEHNLIRGLGGAAGATPRFRINHLGNYFFGTTGGFIGDENGNEYLSFTTVTSAINEVNITNAAIGTGPIVAPTGGDSNIPLNLRSKGTEYVVTSPFAKVQHTATPHTRYVRTDATARTADWGIDNADNFVLSINAIGIPLSIAMATQVATFSVIPVGPNTTPTTDNQLARKKYVDDKVVFFSIPFKIDDPSTFTADNRGILPSIRVPAMVSGGFITKIHVIFRSGSHTSGGTITMTAEINTGSIGTVQINNTNNTVNTWYTNDIADAAIAEGDTITAFLSRSGTITERDVTFIIEGFQKVKSL